MKNVLRIGFFCLALGLMSFIMPSSGSSIEPTGNVVTVDEVVEDDALRCTVTITTDDGNTVTTSCWFCDCKKLLEDTIDALQ